jgi:hypothetical protein
MSKSAIQMCVNGKNKSAGGFVWKKETLSTTLTIE